jgi:hypothetical protein
MMAKPRAKIIADPRPCRTRNPMRNPIDGANPHSTDAAVKRPNPAV